MGSVFSLKCCKSPFFDPSLFGEKKKSAQLFAQNVYPAKTLVSELY